MVSNCVSLLSTSQQSEAVGLKEMAKPELEEYT